MLNAFGLLAVTATLVFYAFEDRGPGFTLAFAGGCVASSVYGFLQGAWPFGIVEIAWTAVAIHRWHHRRKTGTSASQPASNR
jgi:sterol desaturase/sphingolipid hydroxylase (fatty acid hydroxylase superfamily)